MKSVTALRAVSALLAARAVKRDLTDFIRRHGGTPTEVSDRDKTRDAHSRELLNDVRKTQP